MNNNPKPFTNNLKEMIQMCDVCRKHGVELKVRYYMDGTPFQDFDGLFCPLCEHEEKERREQFERDNPHIIQLIKDADGIRKKALMCSPPDRRRNGNQSTDGMSSA